MESGDARVDVDTGGATLVCSVRGEGPLVICAHGFPDCARSFRHQVPALVAAGYRVVSPWLRGYAPSTPARDGRYDLGAIGGDLVALARHFSPGAPARLVGHDWGALAAYAATALAPGAFSHVATVAVPHPKAAGARFLRPAQLRRSWYIGLFQLRGLAERKLAADDHAFIDRLWRDWSPGFHAPPEELAAVKDAIRGRERDVLAYYRAILAGVTSRAARVVLEPTRVRALYVHGIDDGCVGVELCDDVQSAYRDGVTIHRLPGGHFVHQESVEQFNDILVEFLRQPVSTR
ncbi:MAG: Epoxide hydrolase [Myxococcales bacterium]|nr:Epoxide hydrolase [Myxococcales bacterium]